MAKDFEQMENSNRSANPYIREVVDAQRRKLLGSSAAIVAFLDYRAGAAGRLCGNGSWPQDRLQRDSRRHRRCGRRS